MARLHRLRRTAFLPVLALGLTALLGGCVYPAGYGYGYGAAPYYAPPVVAYEGWGWGRHHRERW